VSQQLAHITDWLPTLVSAAGGDLSNVTNLDGFDLWDVLSNDMESPHTEILHNIDNNDGYAAIRVGKYKLVQGDSGYDGWYGSNGTRLKPTEYDFNYLREDRTYTFTDECEVDKRLKDKEEIWRIVDMAMMAAGKDIRTFRHPTALRAEAEVTCNAVPSTDITGVCQPSVSPCLFDVEADPCEYFDLAADLPEVLEQLQLRLAYYNSTVVHPRNKDGDPAANPKYYHYAWTPWQED
jgi:arylsulfatase B